MDEKLPEEKAYDSVNEGILRKQLGFLQHCKLERLHKDAFECPVLVEEGNPEFYKIRTVKRIGFFLEGIVKLYDSPKVSRYIDDVRSENDARAKFLVNDNRYILRVYDHSIYCTIYEYYLYNLEEVCELQKGGKNVRPNLKRDVIDFVKKNRLIMQGDNRPTIFFRDLMQHTLKFLEFLHVRKIAYGGLHPHNIVIVDEECTVKFRGMKCIDHKQGRKQDAEDFVRLVRFCAHGGGRNINNVFNDSICKEAEDFLVIFDIDEHGDPTNPLRKYYHAGFIENRLNISKHPLFWDESMCLNYFLQTHALLVACKLTSKIFPTGSKMWLFQQSLHSRISNVQRDLQALNVQSSNPKDPTLVINGIITRIRNIEGHFPDGLAGVLGHLGNLGSHPIEFWSNLRAKFPGLITGVHRVMVGYTKELSPLFSDHWEKFYPYVDVPK